MEGERLRALPLGENATGGGLILTSMALTALGVVMVFSTGAASTTPLARFWLRALLSTISPAYQSTQITS